MATKSELEAKAAELKSVSETCALALEALKEPKDEDYARKLLEKAELDCSLPIDYIKTAEVYVALGDKEKAEELYEEAEDACFEAMEFAELGRSVAENLGDKEKVKELLENAADSAKKTDEFLAISKYVLDFLGDEELAKKLTDKVEAQCKELKDYVDLAKRLTESGSKETALDFFKKAENKIDGAEETASYAIALFELFGEKEAALEAAEEAAEDAQFTKDFIAIAKVYEAVGEKEKIGEALESAKEYAMTGEEYIELAKAYWSLAQNKEASAEFFEKGLSEVGDKAKLIEYAAVLAKEIQSPELAKKFYQKAETKASGAADLSNLAKEAIANLGDKEYAAEIYAKAAAEIDSSSELIALAQSVLDDLGDKAKAAEIYKKALDKTEKFDAYLDLFDKAFANLADKNFGKEILSAAEAIAESTPQFLKIFDRAKNSLQEKDYSAAILEKAEEFVTNTQEMKDVCAAVKESFPDDKEWNERANEKLAKREANQDKYDAFRKREEAASSFKELRELAEDVIAQVDDKYYARKLLAAGEEILDGEEFNPDNYEKLVAAVKNLVGDEAWILKIIEKTIENRVRFFFDFLAVCRTALKYLPEEKAKDLTAKYLNDYEKALEESENEKPYPFMDLANAKIELLGDSEGAKTALEKALAKSEGEVSALCQIARYARKFGYADIEKSALEKLGATANSAADYRAAAERLSEFGFERSLAEKIYSGGRNLSDPFEKLTWAEGYVSIFENKEAAKKAYSEIENAFKTEDLREAFEISRRIALANKFWD